MAKNHHRVPQRAWRKWNDHQRDVFNIVRSAMIADQQLFLHPKAEKIPAKHWDTVAWNAAWIAAEAAKYALSALRLRVA